MRSTEVTVERTFVVVFEHGENFFDSLRDFCDERAITQGYVPMFIAGFLGADIVGTCEELANPAAPVWTKVHLRNVEALGAGTLARNPDTGALMPHIHTSLGLKEHSATGHTSHLLSATVQFLSELVIVEITNPPMSRVRDPHLHDVPLLRFGA